jgi:hypothetical protein
MQKSFALFLIACFLIVIAAGCITSADIGSGQTETPVSTPNPAVTVTQTQTLVTPTLTGWVYNATVGNYVYVPTAAPPSTPSSIPTQAPTLNKNSAAYLNYKYDLKVISETQTSIDLLTENYKRDMTNTLNDPGQARILTADYNKWLNYYNAKIKTYQGYAAADLEEAGGGGS